MYLHVIYKPFQGKGQRGKCSQPVVEEGMQRDCGGPVIDATGQATGREAGQAHLPSGCISRLRLKVGVRYANRPIPTSLCLFV